MFTRWQDELAAGQERARALSADMAALAWSIVRVALLLGFAIGITTGGFLVWLIK